MTSATGLTPPVTMRGLFDSRFHEMTARSNGEAYRTFVGGPNAIEAGKIYPAVYVLDGKLNFAMVHAQCQILSALGQIPPVFVIGVGYAGDESFFEKDGLRRQRDLTPNSGGEVEAAMFALNNPGTEPLLGGAASFAAFLRDELKPALEATYPIDAANSTILGNSLGGLFPSWLLFHEPEIFQRYVVVSPAWWWNGYEMWKWEEKYARTHDRLDAKLFVAAGGLETAADHQALIERMRTAFEGEAKRRFDAYFEIAQKLGWPKMAELTAEFTAKLEHRRYEGLDLAVLNLPDETHESIPGAAFSRGLRFVFGSWRPASEVPAEPEAARWNIHPSLTHNLQS